MSRSVHSLGAQQGSRRCIKLHWLQGREPTGIQFEGAMFEGIRHVHIQRGFAFDELYMLEKHFSHLGRSVAGDAIDAN